MKPESVKIAVLKSMTNDHIRLEYLAVLEEGENFDDVARELSARIKAVMTPMLVEHDIRYRTKAIPKKIEPPEKLLIKRRESQ